MSADCVGGLRIDRWGPSAIGELQGSAQPSVPPLLKYHLRAESDEAFLFDKTLEDRNGTLISER